MIDNAIASIHTEIHVEIRHGNTFWVEETLKKKIEFKGIQIGDF